MQCYKHVAALLDKQIRKTKDINQKMNVLFMFHNIIKEAKKAHGPKNKLSKCAITAPLLHGCAADLAVHVPTLCFNLRCRTCLPFSTKHLNTVLTPS
jgi:hypothetical protein